MNELLSKLQRCGIVWIAAVMLTQMTAAAQSVLLTGKVVDTDGAPVIGAGIISMQNKAAGTTTDLDGKFSFKVPAGTESVLFSSVGMKDVVYRITPGKTEDITIVMEWESTQLDQVVVTGYAQTTVKRITGSVAVINSDKFEAKAISSVDALMQRSPVWPCLPLQGSQEHSPGSGFEEPTTSRGPVSRSGWWTACLCRATPLRSVLSSLRPEGSTTYS